VIHVENLVKYYAAFPALRDISFSVEPGEVVGFLGPNGAGKTTTLRILTGYMPATEGKIQVAGYDVVRNSRAVRRRVGYLPEDVPLYRDLTVESFLRYMAGLKEVPREEMPEEIERVVEVAGLAPVRRRLVAKCSKGFRQRTGLALSLLGDPPVLLLDEPTSGLDPNQVVEVRELIRRLSGEKTVLLSSHILSEVAQICSRVLIVNQGRLVASGDPPGLARRFGGRRRLVLRVAGKLDPARLEQCPGVLEVTEREPGMFRLTVADADHTAPEAARIAVEAGAGLLELRQETVDLEAVFRAVTAEGGGEDA
jgi:ABC-2 type transport system ATP-binding protein